MMYLRAPQDGHIKHMVQKDKKCEDQYLDESNTFHL